ERGPLLLHRTERTGQAIPGDVDVVHGLASVRAQTIGAVRVADHRELHVRRDEIGDVARGDAEHRPALEVLAVPAVELGAEVCPLRAGDEIDARHAEVALAGLGVHQDERHLLWWARIAVAQRELRGLPRDFDDAVLERLLLHRREIGVRGAYLANVV